MKKKEEQKPLIGFRQCPICKAGIHWECRGGEVLEAGVYLCDCGCEAAQ